MMRRDTERIHDETSGIGPGSSGCRDGVGTGRGTSHNSSELVNKVRDQWYRVPILPGNFVEVPKVNTELKGAIFLLGE